MIESRLARCGRTSRIVEALLDGVDTPIDRTHIASCATCGRASERALRFTRNLAAAAGAVSTGIPDPVLLRRRRMGVRMGDVNLRMAPVATLAAAVAVGLVVAAVIGARGQPTTGQPPNVFAAIATATEELVPLGLVCEPVDEETLCQATAPDHVHRVTLTVTDGRVVEVATRVESTDGTDLDLRGVDDFLARIVAAVLTPQVETVATDWVRAAYPTCGANCSIDLDEMSLSMARDGRSVSLSLQQR